MSSCMKFNAKLIDYKDYLYTRIIDVFRINIYFIEILL